jgi:hypothetical protein
MCHDEKLNLNRATSSLACTSRIFTLKEYRQLKIPTKDLDTDVQILTQKHKNMTRKDSMTFLKVNNSTIIDDKCVKWM